jgi:dynein heavy chain
MGKIAEEEITKARMNGDWICLQNCHVLTSWMSKLEAI